MPSRAARREEDGRAPRFESEVRQSEAAAPDFAGKRKFYCNPVLGGCGRMYEEKSRTCPRCERGRTMGELKPIPDRFEDEAQSGAMARARAGRGARRPDQRS